MSKEKGPRGIARQDPSSSGDHSEAPGDGNFGINTCGRKGKRGPIDQGMARGKRRGGTMNTLEVPVSKTLYKRLRADKQLREKKGGLQLEK